MQYAFQVMFTASIFAQSTEEKDNSVLLDNWINDQSGWWDYIFLTIIIDFD